jgi:hypothetical protein
MSLVLPGDPFGIRVDRIVFAKLFITRALVEGIHADESHFFFQVFKYNWSRFPHIISTLK